MNKIIKTLWISLIIVSNTLYADQAVRLTLGQPAPYAGVLLPEEMATKMKQDLIEADYNKAIIESYKKSIDLYKANDILYAQKVELYSTQNDKLAESLQSERSVSNLGRVGFFLLGILATTAAGFAITRVK